MKGEVMNVVLFMMRQLNDVKMDKNHNLAYAPFRPFKNENGFLTRPLTPFHDRA
jgi:hypothetical protein